MTIVIMLINSPLTLFLTDNTVVEHVACLGKALHTYYNGDTIVVYPGRYNLDGQVYQLADSVHITGMGNYSEIVGKQFSYLIL